VGRLLLAKNRGDSSVESVVQTGRFVIKRLSRESFNVDIN
jgi:hypothetical protein